jgi:Ser/Thr protein kinase RdoA (MazF antagonist)
MKPYENLTYHGRIRRMRQLAHMALDHYDLQDHQFRFLKQAGNTLFRVTENHPATSKMDSPYLPGQYLLRIHQPGYQSNEAIQLELAWLLAMSREANLPVPQPIATKDGKLVSTFCIDGIPGARNVSLLRWVRGRLITHNIGPHHFRAQGILMAKMHEFTSQWVLPAGLNKRKFDWDGLFMDDCGEGVPSREAWAWLPPHCIEPFKEITREVQQLMTSWGKSPEIYGLVHGDLGMDSNLLFWQQNARAIDFDDSGFGYYMYDLSLSLEHCHEQKEYPQLRDALLDGYSQIRPLTDEQVSSLDLFLAAFYIYYSLWAAIMFRRYPDHQQELLDGIERALRYVKRYLARD